MESKNDPKAQSAEFTISRSFRAPRELVFRALTKPECLSVWWGPKGFTMLKATVDLKPGGKFHYLMRSPDGREMWGRFLYREIAPPERIVFTNSFSDEAGNAVRAPFSATFPIEVLNILTLAEANGVTTISMRGTPVDPTAEERATFEGMGESMQKGFGGTFDQLDEFLSSEQSKKPPVDHHHS